MAKNNNKRKFDIPVPIIILAYIAYWPVGIVLTILRSISEPSSEKNEFKNKADSGQGKYFSENAIKNNTFSEKKSNLIPGILTAAGILSALGAVFWAFESIFVIQNWFAFIGLDILLIAAAVSCLIAAKSLKNRNERFQRIRNIIGNRSSFNLTKLASACDESLKRIRKDVQKLIDKGEFGDSAYIDLGANNFMRNSYAEPDEPEAFNYRTVYGRLFRDAEKNEKTVDPKKDSTPEEIPVSDAEISADNDDFSRILKEIRRLNDDIKDVAVSYRIEQIEEHTKNIFEYVTEHPDSMQQIRTFMNYYLPTTLKLLESYRRIERVGVAGENMKKSKDNIENTLDLLVVGFERQVDLLFRNESIDISSDISVLETMMKKDGLSGNKDFDIRAYEAQYSDDISENLSSGGAAAQMKPE